MKKHFGSLPIRPVLALVFTMFVLSAVGCGGGGGESAPSPSPNPTRVGSGWITIELPSVPTLTLDSDSIYISGSAFISPTNFSCCSGSAEDTGVMVRWVNAATGMHGTASQRITYCPFLLICGNDWSASVGLVVGNNVITVTASDPDGNLGRVSLTVTRLPDHTPPTVTSTIPADKAILFPIDGVLTATFSETMDASTINANTFVLYDRGANRVSGTVSYQNRVATFQLSGTLLGSTSYEAQLTTDMKDLSGNALVSPFIWSFTTAAGPDLVPPAVTSTNPASKDVCVAVDAELTATFSKPMQSSTINASTFLLQDSNNTPITGTVTYGIVSSRNGDLGAVFTPLRGLAYLTSYSAKITALATDLDGNPLMADHSWSFTTQDTGTGTWLPTNLTSTLTGRTGHTAIWTGSEMIIWGGSDSTGVRYNPITDSWQPIAAAGAPVARSRHTSVWTGSEMIIWGGFNGSAALNTGARYNPITDTWQPVSMIGAPDARLDHSAVWTGTEMIVWGGFDAHVTPFSTGARYNPITDTWQPINTAGAPAARTGHTAVWTGSNMMIWGGQGSTGFTTVLNTGGQYDPLSNSWQPTPSVGAPSARHSHRGVWTGAEMIVWGGYDGFERLNSGGRLNPVTNSWQPTSTTCAVSGRYGHTAVWTGSEMLIWGGNSGDVTNTGGRYLPSSDTWQPIPTITSAPQPRQGHTAVWTSVGMIVWGGSDFSGLVLINTGGRYAP